MVSYIVLMYIRAPLNFKVALSEMYLALGPFAVRVVIQFSRIVLSSARSRTARHKVRGELFILNRCDVAVNSFLCLAFGLKIDLRGGESTLSNGFCQHCFLSFRHRQEPEITGLLTARHVTVRNGNCQAHSFFFSMTVKLLVGCPDQGGGKVLDQGTGVNRKVE